MTLWTVGNEAYLMKIKKSIKPRIREMKAIILAVNEINRNQVRVVTKRNEMH